MRYTRFTRSRYVWSRSGTTEDTDAQGRGATSEQRLPTT